MKAGEIWEYKEQPSWSHGFNRWVLHSVQLIEFLGSDEWKVKSILKDAETKEAGFETECIMEGSTIFRDYKGPQQ